MRGTWNTIINGNTQRRLSPSFSFGEGGCNTGYWKVELQKRGLTNLLSNSRATLEQTQRNVVISIDEFSIAREVIFPSRDISSSLILQDWPFLVPSYQLVIENRSRQQVKEWSLLFSSQNHECVQRVHCSLNCPSKYICSPRMIINLKRSFLNVAFILEPFVEDFVL